MAGTLQLLPTANSRADRSSLNVKSVAPTMFTHFKFSTKAISKALPYSNLTKISTTWTAHFTFLKTALEHVVLKHKMIQGQLNGEKSQVWKNTRLFHCFAFGKQTPIFIFQTHGCHDSLILKPQDFTVHGTTS